jgi:hypothetical protein
MFPPFVEPLRETGAKGDAFNPETPRQLDGSQRRVSPCSRPSGLAVQTQVQGRWSDKDIHMILIVIALLVMPSLGYFAGQQAGWTWFLTLGVIGFLIYAGVHPARDADDDEKP